jgi:hypothetical protein
VALQIVDPQGPLHLLQQLCGEAPADAGPTPTAEVPGVATGPASSLPSDLSELHRRLEVLISLLLTSRETTAAGMYKTGIYE